MQAEIPDPSGKVWKNPLRHKADKIDRKMTSREFKLVDYCEKFYYNNNGRMPTPEQISFSLRFAITEVNFMLANVQVQSRLEKRGLPWKSIGSSAELNSQQMAVAITVSNFADERSISEKLDQLGVTSAQYYAWLQQPEFSAFVKKLANQSVENIHHEAVLSFNKLIREGDFNAIKYYFELTGVSQTQDVQNLKQMVQLIIESVQKHVKDPDTLAAISQDLMNVTPLANSVRVGIESA